MPTLPKYVVTLMLENRSFDHMLGFSGIEATDVSTNRRRPLDGINGDPSQYCNPYDGGSVCVTRTADCCIPVDPAHDFPDVYEQLVGPGAQYTNGSPYPQPVNTGFVTNYMRQCNNTKNAAAGGKPGDIMQCFDTAQQLPVLQQLA